MASVAAAPAADLLGLGEAAEPPSEEAWGPQRRSKKHTRSAPTAAAGGKSPPPRILDLRQRFAPLMEIEMAAAACPTTEATTAAATPAASSSAPAAPAAPVAASPPVGDEAAPTPVLTLPQLEVMYQAMLHMRQAAQIVEPPEIIPTPARG